jgi:hypothetical protein
VPKLYTKTSKPMALAVKILDKIGLLLCVALAINAVFPNMAASGQLRTPISTINNLNIRLLGTAVGNSRLDCAIVRNNKTGHEKICYLGDSIDGAKLKKIERGKITLSLGDRERVISMEQLLKDHEQTARKQSVETRKHEVLAIGKTGLSDNKPAVSAIYKLMKKEKKFSFQKK